MPKKIPIIDKIKREIPFEWLAIKPATLTVEFCVQQGICTDCRVSGPTVKARMALCSPRPVSFCNDCAPNGYFAQGKIISANLKYICPHKQCYKIFLLDEFFDHLENPCSNMDFLEVEIKRLQNLKFADSKLKDASKALAETNNKLEKNSVEINRLEQQKKDLTKNKKDLEKEVKKFQADVAEIKKLQARRNNPEEIDAFTCAVCLEKYDNNNHQLSCIITCFHSFCYSCLTKLNPKSCPKCRQNFTAEQIKKIF